MQKDVLVKNVPNSNKLQIMQKKKKPFEVQTNT